MKSYRIKNCELEGLNGTVVFDYPKYTTQIINSANQNAQGTRPAVVGQLSELFPEFVREADSVSVANWEKWYIAKHPEAIDRATEKIWGQIVNLKDAIQRVTPALVRNWVYDLIINKTYNGLYVQKAILSFLASKQGVSFRLASPEEESKGIDGYVGDCPYSVKPDTYRTKAALPESIEVKMIYYTKTKTGLDIEVEE